MDDVQRIVRLRTALAERIGQQRYDWWFGRQISFAPELSKLKVRVPNVFLRDWIHKNFREDLSACCTAVMDRPMQIEFEVDASLLLGDADSPGSRQPLQAGPENSSPVSTSSTETGSTTQLAVFAPSEDRAQPVACPQSTPPEGCSNGHRTAGGGKAARTVASREAMTFETLVVGRSNRFAARSAELVAGGLHQVATLLFTGGTGVGKTHLLRSLRAEFRRQHPQSRAIYLTAEQFTCGFVEALRGQGLPSFRQKCRDADLLLLDDVQFFVGKRATLEELLYTIDTLKSSGRRLVLASDRPLGELPGLGAEVVSRLAAGAVCEIESPDFAMRVEIARHLSQQMELPLPEPLLETIATHITSGARELQGALYRLELSSAAYDQPITPELVESTLGEIAMQNARPVKLADIQAAVCDVFGVEASGLRSDGKSRALCEPRMLAMWLARKYTRAPWSEIGEYFGRRSHSTVISAHRRVQRLMSEHGMVGMADKACPVEDAIRRVEAVLRRA